MAGKHEIIQDAVITSWSVEGRGRLYNMRQGLATPFGGNNPIWFGPLTPKFKGFPDTFGFEFEELTRLPIYCVVEVKTIKYPRLSKAQKAYLDYAVSIGGRGYVAMEDNSEKGYYLKEWEVKT